jgi:CheY-like chemotaxis protein
MSRSLLCVDPDEATRTDTVAMLTDALADLDPAITTADGLEEATAALTADLSVLITEYDLPDGTGFELIETARDVCPDATCILYTERDPAELDTDDPRDTVIEYVGKNSAFGDDRLTDLLRTSFITASQTSYPRPQTEAERLEALDSYAPDDPDLLISLDRITDLAATHFDVEIASINLITKHSQEFLACYGPAEDWKSVDRENSICTFTILEDAGVMTVEDVTEDPRFSSRSESLVELGIRSYMGASLVTPAGLVIGTLCVYDDRVRSFSAAEEDYLRDLAATAMDLIHVHARVTTAADDGATQ